jgi:hypothetical protein
MTIVHRQPVRQACGTTHGEPPATTPGFNGQAMVDRVLAELAEHRGRIILVIDDAHELASTEVLAQLARLLASLPPRALAIVSTRRDLWLGPHQLRLADELAEIRPADLRFTEPETRELLEACGVALSETGTALLHRRTEGWAAGLRLAALSLAGHPDPERFVAEFSGTDRTVADYLLAEMLECQPAEVRGPSARSAWVTCGSASPRRPCPAASRSGCGSPPGCAPASAARCTSSTSRPPACTRSTWPPWPACSILAAGPPEDVARAPASVTGPWLAEHLGQ